jgi:hypothetical protein
LFFLCLGSREREEEGEESGELVGRYDGAGYGELRVMTRANKWGPRREIGQLTHLHVCRIYDPANGLVKPHGVHRVDKSTRVD